MEAVLTHFPILTSLIALPKWIAALFFVETISRTRVSSAESR